MQPWTSRGSHALSGAFRTLRPLGRTFTTTPAFERANIFKKQTKKLAKQAKETGGKFDPRSATPSTLWRHHRLVNNFPQLVTSILREMKESDSVNSETSAELWKRFERYVLNACQVSEKRENTKHGSLLNAKRAMTKAYLKDGLGGLRRELENLLYAHDLDARYSEPYLEQQQKIADLRYPAEWYPQARAIQRTIHLHVGPTNSGKTYHALKRLESSKSGFYAGPLRLLAQEVYHRFKSSGIPVSLVTGDEVRLSEGEKAVVVSNTVEMVNLGQTYEVGVIDEIQMIADPRRGWAWTRALLGAKATELHLCGETRVVPLIRQLAALAGDKLVIHRYERLNPLKAMNKSLKGDLTSLQKGDCIVSFSRVGIHALKADIERKTGRRAAIIYGGLPAEIRTQQASLFNDPNNDYDFLVASDAIGMGLNLSCRRIIFETVVKSLPSGLKRLTVPEIKQIGGRAGRYRSAAQHGKDHQQDNDSDNVGYVTSLEEVDLPYIQEALNTEPPPISAAGINPPDSVYEKFAAYFPSNASLAYMVKRLTEIARISNLFFMCDPSPNLENAEIIDAVPGLHFVDQLTFMAAPMNPREELGRRVAMAFERCVLEHTNGRLLDIEEVNLEILEEPVSGNKEYMHKLEGLHRSVILYTWLSYRFGGIFTDRTLAVHVKELVEERMVRALTEFSANKKLRKNASLHRQIAMQKQLRLQQEFLKANGDADLDLSESEEQYSPDAMNASDNEDAAETDITTDENDFEAESTPNGATRESKDAAETESPANNDYQEQQQETTDAALSSEGSAEHDPPARDALEEEPTSADATPKRKESAEYDPAARNDEDEPARKAANN